jgi:heme oxygenase (biliverdin-IX-beta and delta-forming)
MTVGIRLKSLRDRIRSRTAFAHAALEQTPLMCTFADANLSTEVYGAYLCLQWQLHSPLEASLLRWLPPACAELRLQKCDWLRNDLQAMGMWPAASESVVTDADADAGVGSWAQAMGVLYVLEGSTLGLQVVRKQLQDKHPALRDAGRFMLGYGQDTGRHWRDFLVQLETVAEVDWPLAEEAASATFDSFLEGFSRFELGAELGVVRT